MPLTPAEKEARKHARKAAAMNAAAIKSVGGPNSLFKEEAETFTAEDAYWKWRRGKAGENNIHIGGVLDGLEMMCLWSIRWYAESLVGPEMSGVIWDANFRTYGLNFTCHYERWTKCLCDASQVVLTYRLVHDLPPNKWNPDGRRVVPDTTWPPPGFIPEIGRSQFRELFPFPKLFEFAKAVENNDDPTGLFEQVMNQLPRTGD